ncbi:MULTISPECIES: nuclease-related domain-containing protein [unclassified Lysinibacillus]|uniref:nuclease-related domain-containing protein n=1 Tax=unclassified Lysinibacillus TaxID=2636778 RepID=UPI00381B6EA9
MLLKKREVSSKQLTLEMLERRLPKSHPKTTYYQDMLNRTRAGYAGEQRVDREWQSIYLEQTHYLLHDVALKDEGGSIHQMDTLLMSQNFILIVEIKNIVGRVEYMEDNHQFIRITSDDKVDGFRNPFDQVKRHARMLRRLFQMSGHHIPIEYIVVSANPNMIMTSSLSAHPIIHVSGLAEKVEQLFKQHQQAYLSKEVLREFSEQILTMHKPTQWTLDMNVDELKKGVLCSKCDYRFVMHYRQGKWRCENCGGRDDQAFNNALKDYRHMYGEFISNSLFQDFFGISCAKTVYKILKSLQLQEVGAKKDRKYIIK